LSLGDGEDDGLRLLLPAVESVAVVVMEEVVMLEWIELFDLARADGASGPLFLSAFPGLLAMASSSVAFALGVEATLRRNCIGQRTWEGLALKSSLCWLNTGSQGMMIILHYKRHSTDE